MNTIYVEKIYYTPGRFGEVSHSCGHGYYSERFIWESCPKAVARKATAEGVNQIIADVTGDSFKVIQVSGYSKDRGLYCDLLDELGRRS